ncbi:MAG: tyrosine-type recombinase/integrase [Roseibium sp.]|nr:tyrosine-type recombinase/integrase [Roseibium sp.]
MPKLCFTKRAVQAARCEDGKKRTVYADTTVAGLTLEVRETGGKTYYVRYTDQYGAQRNYKIGDATSVALNVARDLTVDIRSKVAAGEDPFAEKDEKRATPTLDAFFEGQYIPFAQSNKKSWKNDVYRYKHHIQPPLGSRRLDTITTADIVTIHNGLKRNGYAEGTANQVLFLIRHLFNLVIKWKIAGITQNPATEVGLLRENHKRERFLSKEEVARLNDALKVSSNPFLYYIVSFLLLTGARKQEALRAAWDDFDFEQAFWLIPETKSGRPRAIPISDHLRQLIDSLPSRGKSDWLFPNPKTGLPYASIFFAWDTARKQAGLANVRLHDLRHSFASFLVNSGRSIYEVQKLLGHAHISTTERYAHLSNQTLASAVSAAGDFVELDENHKWGNIHIGPKRALSPRTVIKSQVMEER